MYNQGEASEQVFRMALNGTEVVAKLTGKLTMHVVLLLFSILKNSVQNRPLRKGEHSIGQLMKKEEIDMFRIKSDEVEHFAKTACDYNIPFHVAESQDVEGNKISHIVVPKSWVHLTSRVIEDTGLSAVKEEEIGTIKGEVIDEFVHEQADDVLNKLGLFDDGDFNEPERSQPSKPPAQIEEENKEMLPLAKEENVQNPFTARTEKSNLSEPTLEKPKSDKDISKTQGEKPSVLEKLKQSKNRKKQQQAITPPKTKNKESR